MRPWLVLVLLAACKNGSGSLIGTNLLVDPCYQKTILQGTKDFQPDYFVADMVYASSDALHPMNRLTIRVQTSGHRIDEADGIYFAAADSSMIANQLGQTIGPTSNLRGTLLLNATCPDHPVTMELDGTVTFSKFGSATGSGAGSDFKIVYGDELAAAFELDVTDRRASTLGGVGSVPTDARVGGHLSGNFDFHVKPGSGAQAYP
jgi:hypothetical protein